MGTCACVSHVLVRAGGHLVVVAVAVAVAVAVCGAMYAVARCRAHIHMCSGGPGPRRRSFWKRSCWQRRRMLFKIYSRLGLFLIRAHQLHRLDAGVGRADILYLENGTHHGSLVWCLQSNVKVQVMQHTMNLSIPSSRAPFSLAGAALTMCSVLKLGSRPTMQPASPPHIHQYIELILVT